MNVDVITLTMPLNFNLENIWQHTWLPLSLFTLFSIVVWLLKRFGARQTKQHVEFMRDVADGLSAQYYPDGDNSHGVTLRDFKISRADGYIRECFKLPTRDAGDVFLGIYEWRTSSAQDGPSTNWQGFILVRTKYTTAERLHLWYSPVLHFLRLRPDPFPSHFGQSALAVIYRRKWQIEIQSNAFLVYQPNHWFLHNDFANAIEDAITVCEAYRPLDTENA